MTLTPKQIEDFLTIYGNIDLSKPDVQLSKEVLYSLVQKVYNLGLNRHTLKTEWKDA